MHPILISAIISGAASFGAAWQIQSWRSNANEKNHVAIHAAEEREFSRMEQKRRDGVIDAVNVARAREAKLRADLAGARESVVGLRGTVASTLIVARTSHDACVVRADALGVVSTQCVQEYQALAEVADRHASDLQTLMDAWPN